MMRTLVFLLTISTTGFQSADVAARFQRAVELQRQGALQEAEAEYRAVLAVAPRYAEAHANLGAVLMRMDRYSDAVVSYESALRLNPGLGPVLLNLGIAHYRKSEFEKAVGAFQRFLERSPGNLQARQLAGLSLVELGRDVEAVDYLTRALEQSPDDPAVLYGLGLSQLRLRRAGVSAIADRLGQIPGGEAASRLLRGQLYLGRLEFERGAAELESAARLNADLPRLYYALGLSYFKLGRNQEALVSFEKELRRSPRDFSTLYYLAHVHEPLGNLEKARSFLDRALALEPDSAEGNALLGKLLAKQGKPADALKPLEAAVAKDPGDTEKRYLLARTYQQLGRREDAARQFNEIQKIKAQQLEKERQQVPKN